MRRLLPPLLIALALAAGPASSRQEPQAPDLARLQAEQRDAQVRARRLRADAAQARTELAGLERRLATLNAEAGGEDRRIEAQRARLRALNAREAELGARMAEARGAQGRVLSSLVRLSRDPPPALLIPAEEAIDTTRAAILLKAMAPELQRRAAAVAVRQRELARVRRLAALSSAELFALESRRIDRRAEIDAMTARRLQLVAVLEAEAVEAERAARALSARLRALGAEPLPVETAEPVSRLPAGLERLTPPLAEAPVARFSSRTPGWRWAADGTEALSPAPGIVAFIGEVDGFGPVIVLDLGPGWRAVVGGVTDPTVQEGARVQAGQPLGRAAEDLYLELRREERPVDPAPWLE
ncbi:MAG: murein hydrolase activator EnvC family protein [Brevundimonas sp.]